MELLGGLSLLLVTQISVGIASVTHPPLQPSQLICNQTKILIGLDVAQLTSSGLDPLSGNLAVHNCSHLTVDNGIAWYEVTTMKAACGNIRKTNTTHAVYSNTLFIYPVSSGPFNIPVSLVFSCVYPLNTNTSMDMALQPHLDLGGAILGSGPKAVAVMSLFHDASYTDKYPPGTVNLPVGSPLYVGVTVVERDLSFVAVLEDCYATYTPNLDDPEKHFLIQNKCPVDSKLVSITQSGTSLQARFTALFFLFQHNYNEVYLHCSLSLCDQITSSCVPSCTRRTKRDVSGSERLQTMTIGPITWDGTHV